MPSREFEKPLAPEVMLRVRLTWTHGFVDRFTVQLELYDRPRESTQSERSLCIFGGRTILLDLAIHELSRNYPAHIARFRKMQEEQR